MGELPRHPKNAPGPFYVEHQQCISCGAPAAEASELVTLGDDGCYFHRQPETAAELDDAVRAVIVSCIGAYRYGGSDPAIVSRLVEAGESGACDNPLPVPSTRRNHVRFSSDEVSALAVAQSLLVLIEAAWSAGRCSFPPTGDGDRAELAYELVANRDSRRHFAVERVVDAVPGQGGVYRRPAKRPTWHVVETGGRYPLSWLHDLLGRDHASELRWFSDAEWSEQSAGATQPYY